MSLAERCPQPGWACCGQPQCQPAPASFSDVSHFLQCIYLSNICIRICAVLSHLWLSSVQANYGHWSQWHREEGLNLERIRVFLDDCLGLSSVVVCVVRHLYNEVVCSAAQPSSSGPPWAASSFVQKQSRLPPLWSNLSSPDL